MDRRSDRPSDGASRGGVRALRPASSGGRVPPHNLQAEESVLGAILLSRESLGAVIEKGLRYDDFYKPSHQQIYDTAVAVFTTGRADAALAASIFHYAETSVDSLKRHLQQHGIPVRR